MSIPYGGHIGFFHIPVEHFLLISPLIDKSVLWKIVQCELIFYSTIMKATFFTINKRLST